MQCAYSAKCIWKIRVVSNGNGLSKKKKGQKQIKQIVYNYNCNTLVRFWFIIFHNYLLAFNRDNDNSRDPADDLKNKCILYKHKFEISILDTTGISVCHWKIKMSH